MVGRVRILLDEINEREITYQGWLNMVRTSKGGNVNVYVDPKTWKYNVWLDYWDGNMEKTKTFSGKLSSFSQREMNAIGSRILKEYPYKETMKAVVANQRPRRS